MSTRYLVVKDLTERVPVRVVELFNERHVGLHVLGPLALFSDLKQAKEDCRPIKGAGYTKLKDTEEYWVLPYSDAGLVPEGEEKFLVLTVDELYAFGWDPIEDESIAEPK